MSATEMHIIQQKQTFHKEWNSDSPQIHAKQQKHHQRQGIKKTKNKKQNNKTKHYDNRITKTQKQD